MRRTAILPPLLLVAVGCKPPPQAPDALEDLCGYIFHHMGDEEPDELIMGIENLDAWLQRGNNLESTIEGYQITNLDQEAVLALDIKNARSVNSLIGAAVAVEHDSGLKKMSDTTVVADWAQVVPKNYDEYSRDFERNPSCFPDRDCTELAATSYGLSKWAGIINVETWNDIEFRWVETDLGWAFAHRSWLTRPAEVSLDGVDVFAQYFLGVTIPDGDGQTIRLMATWIDADYGALPVSEDYAKSQIVTSMQNQGEAIEEYNAEN